VAPYITPDEYTEESTSASVAIAEVSTAIPAFIGYTEIAKKLDDDGLTPTPLKITSLSEFEKHFGSPPTLALSVNIDLKMFSNTNSIMINKVASSNPNPTLATHYLYYSLKLFFANGGECCYIASIGNFSKPFNSKDFTDAISRLESIDEITLYLFPDACLGTNKDAADIANAALASSAKLGDRFTIIDVNNATNHGTTTSIDDINEHFRSLLINSSKQLQYGAAYFPYLNTSMSMRSLVNHTCITINQYNVIEINDDYSEMPSKDMRTTIITRILAAQEAVQNAINASSDSGLLEAARHAISQASLTAEAASILANAIDLLDTSSPDTIQAQLLLDSVHKMGFDPANELPITNIRHAQPSVYDSIITFFHANLTISLPPSGAIAGVYAHVDRNRGVWKSPANVSLSHVVSPAIKIDKNFHDLLNCDDTTGKSINAIRSFQHKGVMVCGSRTLEWRAEEMRYVAVRRYLNMVQESVKKATNPFRFEPNDRNTWLKVSNFIESFLMSQWRVGALKGSTPKEAFFVKIRLGNSMTQNDITNGLKVVKIGLAVLRPTEFIVLKLSKEMLSS